MFPRRKALDMIILSILDNKTEGLTGYSIVKEMKKRFGPMRAPSPGTIYPRLERLKKKGIIVEKGNSYVISAKGKEKLTQTIPEVIDKSLQFMPMLYKVLMPPLPFRKRMNYFSDMCGCTPQIHLLDETLFPDLTPGLSKSIERLQEIKDRLIRAKQEIQERLNAELKGIDEKIELIDEKIKECQEEKKSRVKIPVEDGDLKDE